MAGKSPLHIAVHDSSGLYLVEGAPSHGKECTDFSSNTKVKYFTYTTSGSKYAYIANGTVHILSTPSWKVEHTLEHPNAQEVKFSPNGSYISVWCLYVKKPDSGNSGNPNLHIYDITGGSCKLLKSFFQISQLNWQPQWTGDDSIMARNVTNEVHFYKCPNLDSVAHGRVQPELKEFSLSPSAGQHSVVFFTPSVKGSPCFVNLYKYPNFKDKQQPICSKSFYKVDSVEFSWNKACNAVLLLTSAEKGDDKSYYGEKMVFMMNSKTEEAMRITFNKPGPIASVHWTPDGKHFLAVYGNNPASCSVYDLKGNLKTNLDEGARNLVLINPQSNLAMVGGCGNISPRMEMWDLIKSSKVCSQEVPDMTYLEWSPCGQYMLTATCSPRLRVNNGYRIYHYSGALLYEYLCVKGTELYGAKWVPKPSACTPFTPSAAKVQGITSVVKTASAARYIPPSQRAALSDGDKMVETCKQFLRQIDKYDPNSTAAVANKAPPPLSKIAAKNKKRRDNKRLKDEAEHAQKNTLVFEEPEGFVKKGKPKQQKEDGVAPAAATDDEKKAKNIKKKLDRISKLKKDRQNGKELDKNQLVMLEGEKNLLKELKALKV